MADERRGSFPLPAMKRPRLDVSPFGPPETVSLKSIDRGPELRNTLDSPSIVYEVSSSSDLPNDDCGGDSGFHEISIAQGNTDTHSNITQDIECHDSSGSQPSAEPFHSKDRGSPIIRGVSSGEENENQPIFNHCLRFNQQEDEEEEDRDDVASTISDISGLSDLSDLSGQDWKPIAGPVSWVQQQMSQGRNPRSILQDLVPGGTVIPSQLDEVTLWKIIINILSEPPRRRKLPHVNTLEHFLQLLNTSNNILVLTGAGVSVSSGIPDFRSRNGIYARLSKDFPDLPDPQAMFDIHYFRRDPRPFFKFAKEIYPGQFEPSASHKFIHCLEQKDKLLRNYSQNIDTLEQAAGIQKVITCHGSFATASCTQCRYTVDSTVIKEDIFNQCIPHCPKCCLSEGEEEVAVMKPNIVFFGEGLSDEFHRTMAQDKDKCDLLIVMGSSLKVRPVALIPSSIPPDVPQILINREPLNHLTFDIELLGDCDVIIEEICNRLGQGWSHICRSANSDSIQKSSSKEETSVNNNNIHHKNCVPDTTTESILSSKSVPSAEKMLPGCDEYSSFPHIRLPDGLPSEDGPDTTSPELANNEKEGQSVANRLWEKGTVQLLEGSHYFVPPSRYIFCGAEVSAAECDSELDSCHSDDNTTDPESDMSVDCRNSGCLPIFEQSPKDNRKAVSNNLEDSGFCQTRLFEHK